jgi:hypothetical protein
MGEFMAADRFGRRARWTLAVGIFIAAASVAVVAYADTITPDGDTIAPGDQATVALGTVAPGAVLTRSTSFRLTCTGKQHPDQGQTISLAFSSGSSTIPAGGSLGATNATIGTIPAPWPDDTTGSGSTNCPSPAPTLGDNGDSTVTITAPSGAGTYSYSVVWTFGLAPSDPDPGGDSSAIVGTSTSVSYTLTVANTDTTAPTINCTAPNQTVWYAGDVTVSCTANDAGSGLANPADASFSLSTSVPGGTETANAQTSSHQVCDSASPQNCATAGPYTFKVDKKAPEQSGCDSPDGSWHAVDVTLYCTYTEGGSGPASQQVALSTNVAAGTEDANASASASGAQACDAVGNCATSPADITGNKVDKKAPAVSCAAADGLWHANDVSIACTASDSGSGLGNPADAGFSLTTNVPAGTEDANASTDSHAVADAVGNSATAGPIAGNKVDKKAPTITCNSPTPVFYLNQAPANVNGVAVDGGSGPASQALSAPADTSSVLGNPKSVTLNASDNVGNSSSKQCGYSVVFNFHGFFQPVDNVPTMNRVNAGSAVPVKFDLSGDQGLNIFAAGYPKTKMISCTDSSPLDDIESTVTAGGSSLNYGNGQYVYVWKTEKSWAGQCRELDVLLVDGTMHSAKFRFK